MLTLDLLRAIDARVQSAIEKRILKGTAATATVKSTRELMVTLDGSNQAVPCQAFENFYVQPGDRVGMVKIGSEWVAFGTYGRHLGPVYCATPTVRDSNFGNSGTGDDIPVGQQVYVKSTGELEEWDGAGWMSVRPRRKVKAARDSRYNTTTLWRDPTLQISVEAGCKYLMSVNAYFDSGTTADFKADIEYPNGAGAIGSGKGGWWQGHLVADTGSNGYWPTLYSYNITDPAVPAGGFEGAGVYRPYRLTVTFQAGDGGTVYWRWAQNVASASYTYVAAGSYLEIWKIRAS